MVLGTVLGVSGAALAGFLVLTPLGRYVARAGWEEARILARRRPIAAVIADPATDPALRGKLALVVDARRFAAERLGLTPGRSFTRFSRLDRDTLVLVLSAAYRDRLELRTWWFPVVGRFPYKGFFDFAKARRTAEQLRADGFDVRLGPASAFSSLGWFDDPLVSTTAKLDSVSLAGTVIHEITHSTFFAKGQVAFNESFATFVGGRGAIAYFEATGDSALAERARADWRDERRLAAFWSTLADTLGRAYDALPPEDTAARLAARERILAEARARLVDTIAPALETYPAGWAERVQLDHALLLARRVYASRLDAFDAVLDAEGGDLARAVQRIIALARSRPDDPIAAVVAAAEGAPPAVPGARGR